jgi:hypothetical protein
MESKRERITCSVGSVDEQLNVVILRAGKANGFVFGEEVLQSAVGQFDGAPVFADHAAGPRSVHDLVGRIKGAQWSAEARAVRARLRLIRRAAWVRELIAHGRAYPDLVGLSADLWVLHDRRVVTDIKEVNSVDIVMWPAAGGRFLAQQAASEGAGNGQAVPLSGVPSITQKERVSMPSKIHPEVQSVQLASGTQGVPSAPKVVVAQQAAATAGATPGGGAAGTAVPTGAGGAVSGQVPAGETAVAEQAAAAEQPTLATEMAAMWRELLEIRLQESALPEELRDMARAQVAATPRMDSESMVAIIDRMERAWAQANAGRGVLPSEQVQQVTTPLDQITLAFEQLMGVGDTAAHRGVSRLSGIREMYDLLTGDYERYGIYRADRVTLANATTGTMTGIVANVLNKVLLKAYEQQPQWWKPIAYEEDFSTLNQVWWVTLGGFGDLDTVAEGGSYTEKTWADRTETSTFVKKGNYIGVTLEMIDRDDVAAVRSIPRRLGHAAHRTLSSAVAALFSANGGGGPTLSDGVGLFDATHGNLGSAALTVDQWDVAIQAMFKQTELNSGKRLGIRPRFCLVPVELEKTALTIFTSDQEPGTPNNDANVRRYSAQVITVPEWTDANNWAAATSPTEMEGMCVGYRFGRAPEVFVANDERMDSLFTNDEMRIKVRFFYAVGVGDYRALYKANVAG